jgi:Tfp pilus assembly protein PilZ
MKERETRIGKNIRVMLKDDDKSYPATLINFSKSGMAIKTAHELPTYKIIGVCVKIDQKVLPIQGSVRWVNETPSTSDDPQDQQKQIGISLRNPPPDYLKYFE